MSGAGWRERRSAPCDLRDATGTRGDSFGMTTRQRRFSLLALLALPVVLWVCGFLLLGGDLGKNSDDYALNMRDPVTGQLAEGKSTLKPYDYVFRPIHLALTFSVGTYFPDSDRGVHVCLAVVHGLVVVGVFAMAWRQSRWWIGAVSAAMLFLVAPVHAETVFWFSTVSTMLGTGLYLIVTFWLVRWLERSAMNVWRVMVIGIGAFVLGCLFEQPLAGTAGWGVLCFATHGSWRERVWRCAGVSTACVSAGLAYAWMIWSTAPVGARGAAGSLVSSDRAMARLGELLSGIHRTTAGSHAAEMLAGSLSTGWERLSGPEGVVIGACVIAAAATMLVAGARHAGVSACPEKPVRLDTRVVLAALLVAMLASWLPVYVVDRQSVHDRMMYFPLAMLSVAAAVVIDRVLGVVGGRARGGLASGVIALSAVLAVVGAVSLTGWQATYQRRSRLDQAILSDFVRVLPNPPLDAVLMPITLRDRSTDTGHAMFDQALVGVMDTHWSATDTLRRAYRRRDVLASGTARWLMPALVGASDVGACVRDEHTRVWTRGKVDGAVAWARIVPYEVDRGGRVRVARALVIEQPDGTDLRVQPGEIAQKIERGEVLKDRTYVARTWDDTPPSGASVITGWKWDSGTRPDVPFWRWYIWGGNRTAQWLHPAMEGGARRAMSAAIDGSDRPRKVVVRATIAEEMIERTKPARSVEVVLGFREQGGGVRELSKIELRPEQLRKRRGWVAIIGALPPIGAGCELVVETRESTGSDGVCPSVHVTPAMMFGEVSAGR